MLQHLEGNTLETLLLALKSVEWHWKCTSPDKHKDHTCWQDIFSQMRFGWQLQIRLFHSCREGCFVLTGFPHKQNLKPAVCSVWVHICVGFCGVGGQRCGSFLYEGLTAELSLVCDIPPENIRYLLHAWRIMLLLEMLPCFHCLWWWGVCVSNINQPCLEEEG